DLLLRVFPMRSCSAGTFRNATQTGRPCLLGYIDKCSAPCVGSVSAQEHREIVADFCQFMAGRSGPMMKRLESRMSAAAANLEYEKAGRIRDDLAALKQASERNAIVLPDGTDADVVALAEDPLEVAVQIFHVRGGRVRGERGWVADRVDDADSSELVESFLQQLYNDEVREGFEVIPREILVPAEPPAAQALSRVLTERRGAAVTIRVPQRGTKRTLLDTVQRNAGEALIRHKTKRASDLTTRNRALEEIQQAIDLSEVPLRIECYDISNLQGTEVVASMVVFEDGLPRKSEYRRFVIKGVEGQNDVASMHEVITRRFRRMLDDQADETADASRKFTYKPALVVVDGGPPQVAAAHDALAQLGITDVALCGLAKRLEEVWLPEDEYPVILPRSSEGLYLLQRIRDEAHRFAIGHHRGRRSKTMVESVLDDVPGLGEVRRKALTKHFGSLKKLRAATVEEVALVPGFGRTTAEAVKAALGETSPGEAINTATGEVVTDG
ncbi:MAG: excinuclease ABC subunit UvrC, partial [Propionibacteriales bacterium]|nr:excinuclease ABC subunit UvrC [Propionibacteriales bacterium]